VGLYSVCSGFAVCWGGGCTLSTLGVLLGGGGAMGVRACVDVEAASYRGDGSMKLALETSWECLLHCLPASLAPCNTVCALILSPRTHIAAAACFLHTQAASAPHRAWSMVKAVACLRAAKTPHPQPSQCSRHSATAPMGVHMAAAALQTAAAATAAGQQ
jgi:hypothetical protein